jgi:hypothetical protein
MEFPCILMMQTDVIPRNYRKESNCEAYHVKSLAARDINRVSLLLGVSGTKRCEPLILPVSPT